MIINDKYNFCFIHIPKCAGSTVRRYFQDYDDTNGFYTGRIEEHPRLGMLDYVHIPLFALQEYFELDFNKVKDYRAFAIIRSPYSRFPSSISQYLKLYGASRIQNLSIKEVKYEIDRIIDLLSGFPRQRYLLPYEYIHFQKQVDYLYLDGGKIVDSVYTIENIAKLVEQVGSHVNMDCSLIDQDVVLAKKKENRTVVYRNNAIRSIVEVTRPATKKISKFLPKNSIRQLRSFVYVPRDQRMKDLFSADYVNDFINDYYREDVELVKRLRNTEIHSP